MKEAAKMQPKRYPCTRSRRRLWLLVILAAGAVLLLARPSAIGQSFVAEPQLAAPAAAAGSG